MSKEKVKLVATRNLRVAGTEVLIGDDLELSEGDARLCRGKVAAADSDEAKAAKAAKAAMAKAEKAEG